MFNELMKCLTDIRQKKPLILNITNHVTMDFVANCLLAIGASPIISLEKSEIKELVLASSTINLNIGTLNDEFLEIAKVVLSTAKIYKKPIVLDPVGAGATKIRTHVSRDFFKQVFLVRGNASEIIALQTSSKTLGVDSINSIQEAKEIAKSLCRENDLTIVITGKSDFIVDKEREKEYYFDSPMMKYVTGMGCALSAVIAAFLAVEPDRFKAASLATVYFTLCGIETAKITQNPGSFKYTFIDKLYQPNLTHLEENL